MKSLQVTFITADVYNELDKTTSYIGAKLGELYELYYTQLEDREFLSRHLQEAIDSLVKELDRYHSSAETTSTSFTFNLYVPDQCDDNRLGNVKQEMLSFIVNFIVSKWDLLLKTDQVQTYMDIASSHLGNAIELLNYRTRPTKPEA